MRGRHKAMIRVTTRVAARLTVVTWARVSDIPYSFPASSVAFSAYNCVGRLRNRLDVFLALFYEYQASAASEWLQQLAETRELMRSFLVCVRHCLHNCTYPTSVYNVV